MIIFFLFYSVESNTDLPHTWPPSIPVKIGTTTVIFLDSLFLLKLSYVVVSCRRVLGLLLPTNTTWPLFISFCSKACSAERRDCIILFNLQDFLPFFLIQHDPCVKKLNLPVTFPVEALPEGALDSHPQLCALNHQMDSAPAVMDEKRPDAIQQRCNLLTENSNPL